MKSFRSVLCAVTAIALCAPCVQAQQSDVPPGSSPATAIVGTQDEVSTDSVPRAKGPTLEAAIVGARVTPVERDVLATNELAQQSGFGRAETYMIVGGAAFVAGLLIGDDAGTVVMVGGAAVGLYGLYLYLQTQ